MAAFLAPDLARAAQAWLDHLIHERGLAHLTEVAYARDLTQFFTWMAGHIERPVAVADLAGLSAKTIRGFLAARRRHAIQNRTLARTLSALRMFFRWLEAERIVESRSIRLIGVPKVAHGIPKPLTIDRALAVMDGGMAADLAWVAARDQAVLMLLYGAGLRLSEAVGLTLADAPTRGRETLRITVQGGKGTLKIGSDYYADLEPYVSAAGKTTTLTDTVFSTVPGAPVFVGKAPTYRAKNAKLGINIDMKDHRS